MLGDRFGLRALSLPGFEAVSMRKLGQETGVPAIVERGGA